MPQSKEAAIVMLADTIEASSRSLPDPNPERLAQHIKTMLTRRLQEGELAECELTLRDLGTIENTFIHILRGVLHHRIEYPDPKRELQARTDADAWVREALSDSHTAPPTERDDTPPWRIEPEAPSRDRRRRKRAAQRKASSTVVASPVVETAPGAERDDDGTQLMLDSAVSANGDAGSNGSTSPAPTVTTNGAAHHVEEHEPSMVSNTTDGHR
jgi:hypothetical protein